MRAASASARHAAQAGFAGPRLHMPDDLRRPMVHPAGNEAAGRCRMTSAIRGSCQCGKVSFIVEGGFEQFYLCHCSRGRKDTGSAFGANLFSATSHITWVTGGDHLRTYRMPSTRHARSFCPDCGSALPTTAEG
ncbi:GFA family protein, partial [Nostoc sp. NIES-2111]